MKLRDILNEADVIDFPGPAQQRRYGHGGYVPLIHKILRGAEPPEKLEPVDAPPVIKFNKRPSAKALIKALKQVGVPEDMIPTRFDVGWENRGEQKAVYIDPHYFSFPEHEGEDEKMFKRRREIAMNAVRAALPVVFGNLVKEWGIRGMMGVVVGILADDFVAKHFGEQKPIATVRIKNLFKKHNLGGLGFSWVNKLKTGYGIKFEGVEIADPATLQAFDRDMREEFGDIYKKMKTDKEIKSIGHRPVGEGLTNYRFYFTPELKEKYQLKQASLLNQN